MNAALLYIVDPDYLKARGISLHKGRFFTPHDDNHAPLVVVVDEEFAHKFFANQNPIGKRLELQDPNGEAEIVVVGAHVKQWGLDTDDKQKLRAELYSPIFQQEDSVFSKMVPGAALASWIPARRIFTKRHIAHYPHCSTIAPVMRSGECTRRGCADVLKV